MSATFATLASVLADVLVEKVGKRAKKMDVLRATLSELAEVAVRLEARVARLEQFTNLLDTDQDNIPDEIEALLESRRREPRHGLELR